MKHQINLDYLSINKTLKEHSCVIGFDAFIDTLTRPLFRREGKTTEYFENLPALATYLLQKQNHSVAIELDMICQKAGGNNPIISSALCQAGLKVTSIGPFGSPQIEPEFAELHQNCQLYSLGEPGRCLAYEFSVSKLMNFINMNQDCFQFDKLLQAVGSERKLADIFQQAKLWVFVNMSEQPAVIQLWQELREHYLPLAVSAYDKELFFDLSDCDRLSISTLEYALSVMKDFAQRTTVSLSLNENEFSSLCRLYSIASTTDDALAKLREVLAIQRIILRKLDYFFAIDSLGEYRIPNIVEANPKILTGAGDSQNAGICLGILAGLSLPEALTLGVQLGNYYIRQGNFPKLTDQGFM